ncbi:MAG TPA: serine/threonine-protein kinase [Thermoanaerobaculia bacterium]|nr:serine/threonine-protein kinase [Thermoanaerobaculia bacterium]
MAERADQEFRQSVAIKVVRRGMDTEEIVRRFRSERQILAHLDHPNIARLFDGGTTEDGRPYFVMEHVEGVPIDEYCRDRKLPVPARLELFRQVCSAVHFAHQNLIVHRDLKPGNILVTAEGIPKLLDFGIAKLLDPNQDLFALTRVELRPMTPEYASPEQVRGETITTASDVYSLGVLLYVLLTGHLPYRSGKRDPQGLAKEICETTPPRPSSVIGPADVALRPEGEVLRRRLAGDLDTIVLKAMQKDPARRYASVDQFANDLSRHLQGLPVVARKDTLGYRTRKFVGRHKLGVALAAAALLLIVAFAISVTVQWQRAERERQRAQGVSDFLEDLLSKDNPAQTHGEEVSVRTVLDRGVKDIDRSLSDQPEVMGDLKEIMGRSYKSLGLYSQAKPLLQDALRLHSQTRGREDLIVAQDLHNLAGVFHELGDDNEVELLSGRALAIERKQGAARTLDFAKGLSNYGNLLEGNGKYDQAEAVLKEALSIKQKLPHPDPKDIAYSFNSLGALYEKHGDYAKAEENYKEALEIRQKLAGDLPDPNLATSLGNLASVREDEGDLAGAEKFHRQALEMRRRLYPGPNAKLTGSLSNLGHVLTDEHKLGEAESDYREALAIADANHDFDPQKRAIFLRNLAAVLLSEGKPLEAEAKIREALAVFRVKQPPSWRVADAESVLGACLTAEGRYQEAEKLLTESYPLLQNDRGDGAKHAATETRQRIADLSKAWGRPVKPAS